MTDKTGLLRRIPLILPNLILQENYFFYLTQNENVFPRFLLLNRINFFNLRYMSNQGIKRVVCTISNFAASKNVLCILLNLNYIVEIQPFQLSITFFYNSTLIHIILFNLNRDSFMKWISFVN